MSSKKLFSACLAVILSAHTASLAELKAIAGVRTSPDNSQTITCSGNTGTCAIIWVEPDDRDDLPISNVRSGFFIPDLGTGLCDVTLSAWQPSSNQTSISYTTGSTTFAITSVQQLQTWGEGINP